MRRSPSASQSWSAAPITSNVSQKTSAMIRMKAGIAVYLPGENPVDPAASHVFPAFMRLHHRFVAEPVNKDVTHVGDRGRTVKTPFGFHLLRDNGSIVSISVLVEFQLLLESGDHPPVSFAAAEPDRNCRRLRVILNQMHDTVKRAVHRASMVICSSQKS